MNLLLSSRGSGLPTYTGQNVTALSALQNTAVFACVRVLAESVASLPLILYERTDRGKRRAINHHLFNLLHLLPNPELTAFELREVAMGHLGLWGNAYLEIQRDRGGRVMGLWPLTPRRVDIQRVQGRLVYTVALGDLNDPRPETQHLDWSQVWHIKGFGHDGVRGLSPIGLARQAVGLALATEKYGAKLFENGARPGAVLEHPGELSDGSEKRLRESWEAMHSGLDNAHRIAILEEGLSLKEVGIPPEDAQFLQTRRFQVEEVGRMYRVPLHMIGDLTRSTNNNIEHQGIEFVQHTLRPWLVRWEQSISRDLLSDPERSAGLFAEHLVDALLRGDTQSRYGAYSIGRNGGWLSVNDIREKENMNLIEDGDDYLRPLNMAPAGSEPETDPDPDSDPDSDVDPDSDLEDRSQLAFVRRASQAADDRLAIAQSFETLLQDITGRIFRREINDMRRAVDRLLRRQQAVDEFREWLSQFYTEHREFWQRHLMPALVNYADQIGIAVGRELDGDALNNSDIEVFIENYTETLAARQANESQFQIVALLDEALTNEESPADVIDERLDGWEASRPGQVARDESRQAGNAFTRQFYILAGIQLIRWQNRGSENCPYCRDLDGRVVGIMEVFIQSGVDLQPDGADRPLSTRKNIGHPPLHKGCDCQITAER